MSGRAIIVDDNEENLYFLKTLLESRGFETITAKEGASALARAQESPPDIIISDILMPGMDGFALCRRWKQDPRLKGVPFVFYTATYTDEEDEAFALRLGADRFIIKPSEPQAFMERIGEVLKNRETGLLTNRTAEFPSEATYLREYNVVLINKLEDKLAQLEKANGALTAALAEKETLLRELYHRTKNNLHVIAAMFELQAERTDERAAADALHDMLSRVKALALVQEKLYQSKSLSRINLQDYLRDLAKLEMESRTGTHDTVRLLLDLEPCVVSVDTAMPCGLVVNELFTNAINHAFPRGRQGEIGLRLRHDRDGNVELTVFDNGVGLAPEVDVERPATLGLQTTRSIVECQLRGSIAFIPGGGLRCVVRFRNNAEAGLQSPSLTNATA